jgi:hypothetical protein
MAPQTGPGLLVIERILRDRAGIWQQIIEEKGLRRLTGQMLSSSAISLALYGVVLGFNFGPLQALSSAVKLPLLFLATLAICLPTLYLFNLVFGARLSVLQAVTLIMVSITVTSVLTLAFAPISLFFLITANNYSFFKLLNVCILVLTALVGLKFLTAGMRTLNDHHQREAFAEQRAALAAATAAEVRQRELVLAGGAGETAVTAPVPAAATGTGTANGGDGSPPAQQALPALAPHLQQAHHLQHPQHPQHPQQGVPGQRPASMTLLYIWILLFGFVGTQLGWTLRPFFGSPGEDFAVFRNLEGTFYGDIFATIARVVTGGG